MNSLTATPHLSPKVRNMIRIESCGIVAIISGDPNLPIIEAVSAIVAGGVDVIEVLVRDRKAFKVIEAVADKYGDEILLGAGTLMHREAAWDAYLAGAEFFVCPVREPEIVTFLSPYNKVTMLAGFTPCEVREAAEAGPDYVKLFPSEWAGAKYLTELSAPFPDIPLIPTGGINATNLAEFFATGRVYSVGVSGEFREPILNKQFDIVTQRAQKLVTAVAAARTKMK